MTIPQWLQWIVAAVFGAITMTLAYLTYQRARVKVLMHLEQHPFWLPAAYKALFSAGQQALARRSQGEPSPSELPRDINLLLDRIASIESLEIGAWRVPTTYWELRIENRGHDTVEGARLVLESGKVAQIRTQAGYDDIAVVDNSLDIPEIRPSQSLRLSLWASGGYRPELLLKKGRVRVLVYSLLGPPWVAMAYTWRQWGWLLLVMTLGVLLNLFALLLIG